MRRTVDRELRWIVLENGGWSQDRPVPGGASSPAGPGTEAYKGLLYSLRTGAPDLPVLWYDFHDKDYAQWYVDRPANSTDGKHTHAYGAPAVTHANDYLYCVHHRTHDDRRLWWTRFNTEGPEVGWSPQRPVTDHRGVEVRSTHPAAVTVYDGLLYCVHVHDGLLLWITHDTATKTWGVLQAHPGDIRSVRRAAVDTFKDHLYCVHDRGGDDLYWTVYDSKTQTWSYDHQLVDWNGNPVRTKHAPALAHYNDYLYCVYYAGQDSGNGRLWWTRFDRSPGWSPPQAVPGAVSSPGFDIAPYGGALYCVHRA
ncbi:hypothetical protein AB0E96_19205 [Kitasatospora sp. NPDC036755]|uniref:hypothetical protein n=1 Tax=Kitasatospora sp. NPDC036755 TaxID=3154600 RepID=UPI0033E320F8